MTKRSHKRLRNREEYDEMEDDLSADEEVTTLPKRRRKKRRRFPYFTFSLLILVGGAILLAPTIISMTPLGPNMVASAAKDQIQGTITVKSVSLGWLSPLRLNDVALHDSTGKPLGTVKSITINKSILGLLGDMTRLDTITVEEPQFQLVVRPDGSNLEDLLAPLMKKPASGGSLPEFDLQVVNATLELVDAERQKSWQFSPLAAQITSPRQETPWTVHVEGKVQNAALLAHIQHALAKEPAAATPTKIELRTDQFPLESLRPILARVVGDMQLQGTLSGKMDCSLDAQAQPQQLHFENVEAKDFQIAAARYLGPDPLQVQHCKANGLAQYSQGVWQLKDLQVESDVAALAGTGDVRVSDFTSGNALPQSDCNVRGVVDVAKLAQMFPHILKVREGVEIVAGRANVILVSHAAGVGRRFEASLTMENLQAKNQGQLVSLKEPVALGAVVTQSSQGWKIEKLDAKSSFLTADVTGTPENGKLEVRGDLQRLKDELSQFFDLTGVKLAGSLAGDMQWQTAGAAVNASAEIRFTRLSMEMPNMLPWNEDELKISFQGEGLQPVANSYAVASGSVHLESEQDKLQATLREPVRAISVQSPMPVAVKLTGNLATWLPRLQAFVPLQGWQVSGPIELTADANVSATRIDAPKCQFKIQQLHAAGNGMHVREPIVQGETKLVWDATTGTAAFANTMLQSTSLAVAADKMEIQTAGEAKISGSTALRGDLGKLLAWWSDPNVPAQTQCLGELEAEIKFSVENNTTRANLAGKIDKLAIAQRTAASTNRLAREVSTTSPWQTVWTEPQVIFGGGAAYNAASDTITLNQMQTKAGTSIISTSGTIAQLSSSCVAHLKGEVRYDLGTLSPLARPYLGDTFSLVGVTAKPFELQGPLFSTQPKVGAVSFLPASLTGKAGLNWDSVSWMSLEMGGGELLGELKNSAIYVQPAKIPLSQGTVNLSPVIVLNGPQWYVAQEHVKLIDHVVITPQMCNQWIKYMAPLLVGATQAEGKFSIDVENAQVPLQQVEALNAKGVFTVHSVVVGPGPLAQQMIDVANKLKSFVDGKTGIDSLLSMAGGGLGLGSLTGAPAEAAPVENTAAASPAKQWLELPEQEVPVDIAEGRVRHQGLSMKVQDIIIRTSGSVGIADQSLSLVAEIPILDAWIKDKRELAALKGQSIQIPITGSVTQPRLDTRGLVTFGKNFAFQAGRGMIDEQLRGGLEKGTSAVQSEVGKVQNKITEEVQKGKQKIESELRDSLKGIFGS